MKREQRHKTYEIILYVESENLPSINEIISTLDQLNYDYAYILHNKDIKDYTTFELKKPHFHILLHFNNAISLSTLSNKLNIPSNYIEIKEDLIQSLLYLIHYNISDKTQYLVSEVDGPMSIKLKNLVELGYFNENTAILNIIDYIETSDKPLTYRDLLIYCVHNNILKYYKNYQYTLNQIMQDHNKKFIIDLHR